MSWFDAENEKAELNTFLKLPTGNYRMLLKGTEVARDIYNNEYIYVQWQILSGEYEGRTFTDRLFLTHDIAGIQNSSRAKLKILCEMNELKSLGGPRDLEKLHGTKAELKVTYSKKEKDGKEYENNYVNGITPLEKKTTETSGDDVPW